MAELPAWIVPGDAATLVWYSGRGESAEGVPLYQVAGPALDAPPASPYFLLAPLERDDFASRLYRGLVDLPELRGFLDDCTLARGEMSESLDRVAVRAETAVLPVLDAWRVLPARPLLPYLDDIGAFLPGARPLFVTPEAYATARQEPEQFGTAWVCDECGEAEDAAAFLWTAHAGPIVRVCFLIQNDAGVWSCRLHPFEFLKEAA
ncbi:MAG TPA: hypothetical protein VGA81_18400 [Methylomirabilota bacterium]|jgi:hypothetical protein